MKKNIVKFAVAAIGLGLFTQSLADSADYVKLRDGFRTMSPADQKEYRDRNIGPAFESVKSAAEKVHTEEFAKATVERVNQNTFKMVYFFSQSTFNRMDVPSFIGAMRSNVGKEACQRPEIRYYMLDVLQLNILYVYADPKGKPLVTIPINQKVCASK